MLQKPDPCKSKRSQVLQNTLKLSYHIGWKLKVSSHIQAIDRFGHSIKLFIGCNKLRRSIHQLWQDKNKVGDRQQRQAFINHRHAHIQHQQIRTHLTPYCAYIQTQQKINNREPIKNLLKTHLLNISFMTHKMVLQTQPRQHCQTYRSTITRH